MVGVDTIAKPFVRWKQYLTGIWSRHQNKPEVVALYQSKLLMARHRLSRFVIDYRTLKLPVTFDNWYTQSAFCRFLSQELNLPPDMNPITPTPDSQTTDKAEWLGWLAISEAVLRVGNFPSLMTYSIMP